MPGRSRGSATASRRPRPRARELEPAGGGRNDRARGPDAATRAAVGAAWLPFEPQPDPRLNPRPRVARYATGYELTRFRSDCASYPRYGNRVAVASGVGRDRGAPASSVYEMTLVTLTRAVTLDGGF
jgi:hypothetical protein